MPNSNQNRFELEGGIKLIILILLISCQSSFGQPITPLLENTIYRTFSNPNTKDKFSLVITGKSISEGKMIFAIENSSGRTIHSEEYPSNFLIGYGLIGENLSKEQKEEYIRKRVAEFFENKNFIVTPIKDKDEIDEDYSDMEIWNDIKSDKTAVGFYYLIGEEAGCWIAYSKKQNKTVKYFCCC